MDWISAFYKHPAPYMQCIVVVLRPDGTRYIDVDYLNDEFYWQNNSVINTSRIVTHWMPAPELPKED